jgi:PAS domain S-box-containing protein
MVNNLEEEVAHLREQIENLEKEKAELEVYKETVEYSPEGYLKISPEGIIMHANAAIHKILNYNNKELIGVSVLDIYPLPYKDAMATYLETLVKNKPKPKQYNGEYRRKDGSSIEVRVQWSYITGKYDEVTGFINIVDDLTEQKQRESLLYNHKSRIEALIDHAPFIIAEFDSELRHQFMNKAIERTLGISPEYFIGKTTEEAGLPEELAKPWMKIIKEVFEKGQPAEHFMEIETPLGLRKYMSTVVPVCNNYGRIKSVMSITTDITSLEEKINNFRKANAPHT